MPELPEVETIRRDLGAKIVGRKITDVSFLWPKTLRDTPEKDFRKKVLGRRITSVDRRAKLLVMALSGGENLIFHMKMTGHLLVGPDTEKVDERGNWVNPKAELSDRYNQYVRAVFWLSGGMMMAFSDLRKFGYVKLANQKKLKAILSEYGPEPLSDGYDQKCLEEIFCRGGRAIKKVLIDQASVAGIGNIYADEILFASRVHPEKKAKDLSRAEVERIVKKSCLVIEKAIKLRGTSYSDYRDTAGRKGDFEKELKVYGRAKEKCYHCNRRIRRIVVGGRGTHFCPGCQELK